MTFIFVLSHREKVAFTDNYTVSFSIFKTLHLVEYAILYLLWWRTLKLMGLKSPYLMALFFTFAYGLSDELHQSLITGREGKLFDAYVDGLGGILGWVIQKKVKLCQKCLNY